MSQGFTNIPSYFFQFLNHSLQAFQPPYSSTLILGGGGGGGVQSLSPVQLFSTPWTAACYASLSITNSRSLLKLMSIESVMPSSHFSSSGQNIGASASASVLPMNIQDWSPLGLTGWISLQSKGLSRVYSNTTVQKYQFFGDQFSL